MTETPVLVETDAASGVASITLNRPQRLNAITQEIRRQVPEAFTMLAQDPRVRVIVIQGAGGKAFSAGADVNEFQEMTPDQFMETSAFYEAPSRCSKPVIAAIQGYCLGGGMELALGCDFRVASRVARLKVVRSALT